LLHTSACTDQGVDVTGIESGGLERLAYGRCPQGCSGFSFFNEMPVENSGVLGGPSWPLSRAMIDFSGRNSPASELDSGSKNLASSWV
jgi:hypothetical protein